MSPGCVYLVGAGPGDPELLTLKALRLLQQAEIVVYDRLVSAEVMALVPAGVSRVFVGKASGHHTLPQAEINALLIRLAGGARRIVRLKGGDPYIFGRGSEEALALAAQGIPFVVVPGITAGIGCGAAAGIPMTHRGLASGVRFVTGHSQEGKPLDLNWASLADPDTTLVFYMATQNLAQICAPLLQAGLAAETPAAVISCGTTARQSQQVATLATLPACLKTAAPPPPCLVVIGRVVSLMAQLHAAVPVIPDPCAADSEREVRHA